MARAGITFYGILENVFTSLHYVFAELLDYQGDINRFTPMHRGFGQHQLYGSTDIGPLSVKDGLIVTATGTIIDPWDLRIFSLEEQQMLLWFLPLEYFAKQASDLTSLKIWMPSQLDILENGDLEDVRIVVNTGVRNRSEVIETIQEVMPRATVISQQVHEVAAIERIPGHPYAIVGPHARPARDLNIVKNEAEDW